MKIFNPLYVVTALTEDNDHNLSIKGPLVTDEDTPGAMFQTFDYTNGISFVNQPNKKQIIIWNQHATETGVFTIASAKNAVPNKMQTIAPGKIAFLGLFTNDFGAANIAVEITSTGITGVGVVIAVVDLR